MSRELGLKQRVRIKIGFPGAVIHGVFRTGPGFGGVADCGGGVIHVFQGGWGGFGTTGGMLIFAAGLGAGLSFYDIS